VPGQRAEKRKKINPEVEEVKERKIECVLRFLENFFYFFDFAVNLLRLCSWLISSSI
jgi:hypothetical protein